MGICPAEAKSDITTSLKNFIFTFTIIRHHSHRWRVSPQYRAVINLHIHRSSHSINIIFATDNNTSEGSSFSEVSPSICPAEVYMYTATNVKETPLASFQTSLLRDKPPERIPLLFGWSASSQSPKIPPLNAIFNEHLMEKSRSRTSFIKPNHAFIKDRTYHNTASEGSSLCEVSPSICPTEAFLDTAALEEKSLLAETNIHCCPHNRRLTQSNTSARMMLLSTIQIHAQAPGSCTIHRCIKVGRSTPVIQVSESCLQKHYNPMYSTIPNTTSHQLLSDSEFNMTFALLSSDAFANTRDWERTQKHYTEGLEGLLIIIG